MSMPLSLRCHASGRQYTEYVTNSNPDSEHRIPCPLCGKDVKLAAKYRAAARCYTVIPAHNRSAALVARKEG